MPACGLGNVCDLSMLAREAASVEVPAVGVPSDLRSLNDGDRERDPPGTGDGVRLPLPLPPATNRLPIGLPFGESLALVVPFTEESLTYSTSGSGAGATFDDRRITKQATTARIITSTTAPTEAPMIIPLLLSLDEDGEGGGLGVVDGVGGAAVEGNAAH